MDTQTVGAIAAVITVVYTCLGIPSQVLLNYRTRSTSGLSLVTQVLSFGTFMVWVVYGVMKPDWFIVVSNLPGVFFLSAILVQFVIFRKRG